DRAEQIARNIEDWQSESHGLMPLFDAVRAAEQGQRELQHVESAIENAEEVGARVVNLCFLHGGKYVPEHEPLLRDVPYELRLQIGKPWGNRSIVRGVRPLPDHYLDAHSDESGIGLDVCLYSEDFWLPEGEVFPLRLPRAPAASNHLDIPLMPKRRG